MFLLVWSSPRCCGSQRERRVKVGTSWMAAPLLHHASPMQLLHIQLCAAQGPSRGAGTAGAVPAAVFCPVPSAA